MQLLLPIMILFHNEEIMYLINPTYIEINISSYLWCLVNNLYRQTLRKSW